jgi:hypothetical protein
MRCIELPTYVFKDLERTPSAGDILSQSDMLERKTGNSMTSEGDGDNKKVEASPG